MISTVACHRIQGLTLPLPCLNICGDEMKTSKIYFHFYMLCAHTQKKRGVNVSYFCQNSTHATEQTYIIST